MTNNVLCIYHADCADGLGAAWAVHRALGDQVDFVAAKYEDDHELLTPAECVASGNCPSQEDVPRSCNICDGGLGYCKRCHRAEVELDQPCGIPSVEGRNVLIVDFSYPLDALRAMAREARSVLVLDHHKTAQADLSQISNYHALHGERGYSGFRLQAQYAPNALSAIFDMDRSGAGIAWDYLVGGPRSPLIDLIEDRNLWRFKLPDSRAFHAVLSSHPWQLGQEVYGFHDIFQMLDVWHEWATADVNNPSLASWYDILRYGCAILRAQDRATKSAVAASRRTMQIAGHVIPVANVPAAMASDAGHLLCQEARIHRVETKPGENISGNDQAVLRPHFSATYYDGADGKRHFSLRSPPGGADVGVIAKKYGGGGHEHAAGFDMLIGWEGE